jgi:hypothetical protein
MWQQFCAAVSKRLQGATQFAWDTMNHFDRQQWLVALAIVTIVGFFCMRGFGSRSKY